MKQLVDETENEHDASACSYESGRPVIFFALGMLSFVFMDSTMSGTFMC